MPDRFEEEQQRRRSVRSVASAGADPADDDPLMAALRAWRTARAREDAVPAYVVFHDQTLAAIAEVRPATLAGLRRIKGIGPAKLDTYGDEILEVVRVTLGGALRTRARRASSRCRQPADYMIGSIWTTSISPPYVRCGQVDAVLTASSQESALMTE